MNNFSYLFCPFLGSHVLCEQLFTEQNIYYVNIKLRFCEVQNKRTEQSFKINSLNAEWCKIQSCINSKIRKIIYQQKEGRILLIKCDII
ncbi:hypothetical protein BpHYR1_002356 [Brachionus plicatilis]|uniref:Uncharacterized protein n=1 Tax=Brachionus plicatilis TaxID=10195 RepID=A0A3M7Q5Y7_BRAPC|nr:hypothetical protein BpHYR1_002356 [Brachionus plicatilis]